MVGNLPLRTVNKAAPINSIGKASITKTTVRMTGVASEDVFVGADPGSVNMGLAVIENSLIHLYQIQLPSDPDSMVRIYNTMDVVNHVLAPYPKIKAACIEQAAYGALYGQTSLAEIRTAMAIAIGAIGVERIFIETPKSIRKAIYGSGEQRSQEKWPTLPPDAGSALGCALFAFSQGNIEKVAG